MKKRDLKKLALLGFTSGSFLLTAGCSTDSNADQTDQSSSEKFGQRKMTENELLDTLDAKSKRLYQSMDAEGKAMALQLANQSCKGQNSCKGMNSCKTASNSCAGTGSCKGTSPGPFKDKNKAVEVAAKKMEEKRKAMSH